METVLKTGVLYHLLPTLVLLSLVIAIVLALRQVWAYLETVVTRGRPEDPESAEIYDACQSLLQPTQLLSYAFLAVLFMLAGRPIASRYGLGDHFYPIIEAFVTFLVCSGLFRYFVARLRHVQNRGPAATDVHRRFRASLQEFNWRCWVATIVFLVLLVIILPLRQSGSGEAAGAEGRPGVWLLLLVHFGILVWRVAMLIGVAWFAREGGGAISQVVSLSLISWGMGAIVYFHSPEGHPANAQVALHVVFTGLAFAGILRSVVKDMTDWALNVSARVDNLVRERRVLLDFLTELGVPPGSQDFEETFNLRRLLERTLAFVMRQVDATAGAVFMAQGKDEVFAPVTIQGMYPPVKEFHAERAAIRPQFLLDLVRAQRIRPGDGIVGESAHTGETILVEDATKDPRVYQPNVDYLQVHTSLAVPLRTADGTTGVISLVNKNVAGEPLSFTHHDRWLVEAIAEQASVTLNNAHIHRLLAEREVLEMEMRIAQQVQQALLPQEFPEIPGFDIQALSEAARRVGGDYFDFLWLSETELAVVIADVSGKGVPGAITMSMVKTLLRSLFPEGGGAPARLEPPMCRLNAAVYRDTREDSFVSLTLGILDVKRRAFRFVRAGHEPTLLMRAGGGPVEEVVPTGIALGMDEGPIFEEDIEETEIVLSPGDTIVLYTDGVTEAMNAQGEEFSLDRLLQVLVQNRSRDAAAILGAITERVRAFAGSDAAPHDDLTLVILKAREEVAEKGDRTDAEEV